MPEKYRAPDAEVPALPNGDGLVVVANCGAGDGGSEEVARRIVDTLPAARVRIVSKDEDLVEVLTAAVAGVRVLGIAGGDGSINAAARAALDGGVPLVVSPTGTLNHFAGEVGIDSVEEALDAVAKGSGALVDVACAELDDGGREIFLNNASIGGYPEMVAAREQLEDRLGKWPAMFVALGRILRHSEPVEVEVDGEHRRLWLLFAGNCVYAPAGVRSILAGPARRRDARPAVHRLHAPVLADAADRRRPDWAAGALAGLRGADGRAGECALARRRRPARARRGGGGAGPRLHPDEDGPAEGLPAVASAAYYLLPMRVDGSRPCRTA